MNFKKFLSSYRKELDGLFKSRGFIDANYFNGVESLIPKGLEVLGLPDTPEFQMNCHGYTFNTKGWFEQFKINELIKNGLLVRVQNPTKGDIILYIDDGGKMLVIKHSGIYETKGMVRSKWSNGPIFRHKIFEAPFSYGDKIAFYRRGSTH